MMCMFFGMMVINFCDYYQIKVVVIVIVKYDGLVYFCFGCLGWLMFIEDMLFEIGKVLYMVEGSDVFIFVIGYMVW